VASCKGILDQDERDLLLKMVDLVDDHGEEPLVSKKINNIDRCHSLSNFKKQDRQIY